MKPKFTLLPTLFFICFFSVEAQEACLYSFAPPATYTLGAPQLAITSADFNQDGHMDIATANGSLGISVVLGSATGVFTSVANFTANLYTPSQIKAADFNNDGHVDLVLTNSSLTTTLNPYGDHVTFLPGNGNGTFGTASHFTVAPNSYRMVIEDFNADGYKDLVISNNQDLNLVFGQGNGSFSAPTSIYAAGFPYDVISKDFNNDGKIDLAVTHQTNTLTVLLASSSGTLFTPVSSVSSGTVGLYKLIAEDFDGDGKPDISCVTSSSTNRWITSFKGNGDGSFQLPTWTNNNVMQFPTEVLSEDFNKDGHKDFVVCGADDRIVCYKGKGNLLFNFGNTYYFNTQHDGGMVTGDFNMDGKPDLACTHTYPSEVILSVFLNNTSIPSLTVASSNYSPCAGESVTLQAMGANTYTWSTQESTASVVLTPSSSTNYTVIGEGNAFCLDTLVFAQTSLACVGLASQDKLKSTLHFYPNPASNELYLETDAVLPAKINLFNFNGQLVKTIEQAAQGPLRIDVSALDRGLYFLKINNNSLLKLILE